MRSRKPPASVRILNQWVDSYARQLGLPPARVRSWVSHMVLGGALERAGYAGAGRRFTIKGGVALEMRLRHLARATRDLDLILDADEFDPAAELQGALQSPYEGFTFRLRSEPEVMPNGAVRMDVTLLYRGKGWGTVQVDVARDEGTGSEVELVEAVPLDTFGIQGPEMLPCISLPYHIAQKIHGMTLPAPSGKRNERFRDLIDLLLLREWVSDYEAVKRACQAVFATRGTHAWPPFFEVPEHWVVPFQRMAGDVQLKTDDIYQAAIEVRQFIRKIDDSAEWIAPLPAMDGLSATTWYYAVGGDGALHRVSARIGETVFTGEYPNVLEIRSEWQRDPGGVALIGVVMYLRNRRPVYIEGVSTAAVALTDEMSDVPVEYGPEIWSALAHELLRRTRSPERAILALSVYLSKVQVRLPCVVGHWSGTSTQQAHWWRIHWSNEWFLWDLEKSTPVLGKRRRAG